MDMAARALGLRCARIEDDGRRPDLASERRIVRWGEGLQPSRCLQPAPMARVLETIAEWMPVIERVGAREVVAVGPRARRDAPHRVGVTRGGRAPAGAGGGAGPAAEKRLAPLCALCSG